MFLDFEKICLMKEMLGFLKELEKASAKVLPLETDRDYFRSSQEVAKYWLETDVAVLNEGFFYIQPANGEVALSRRGDFGINSLNQLVNGVGDLSFIRWFRTY